MGRTVQRALHVAMTVAFGWFTYLQFNDADAVPWITIYAVATIVAALGAFGAPPRTASVVVGLVAFAWAMALLPSVPAWFASGVRTQMNMQTGNDIEREGRDCLGLLIVVFWCLITLLDAQRRLDRSSRRSTS